jgi:hypothetical protein
MKMHLTGMENFNMQQKRGNLPLNNTSNGAASTNDTFTDSRTIS